MRTGVEQEKISVNVELTLQEYATLIVALRWEMTSTANRVLRKLGKKKALTDIVMASYGDEAKR